MLILDSHMLKEPFLIVGCFTCHVSLIAVSQFIAAHGIDLSVGVRLLSGEMQLLAKNLTGRWWDSDTGPCRYAGHCCKRAKPLYHPKSWHLISTDHYISMVLLLTNAFKLSRQFCSLRYQHIIPLYIEFIVIFLLSGQNQY